LLKVALKHHKPNQPTIYSWCYFGSVFLPK
jgi:hypothetical protein